MSRILSLLAGASLAVAPSLVAAQPAASGAPVTLSGAQLPVVAAKATLAAGPCPVALSAHSAKVAHNGGPTLVTYDNTITPSAAWVSDAVLVVPQGCGGRYLLTLSFTKDAKAGACISDETTTEDVVVAFYRRPQGAPSATLLGSNRGAWAGRGHAASVRMATSYALVAVLEAGDQITTWSQADGDAPRCLRNVSFSAATLN